MNPYESEAELFLWIAVEGLLAIVVLGTVWLLATPAALLHRLYPNRVTQAVLTLRMLATVAYINWRMMPEALHDR